MHLRAHIKLNDETLVYRQILRKTLIKSIWDAVSDRLNLYMACCQDIVCPECGSDKITKSDRSEQETQRY